MVTYGVLILCCIAVFGVGFICGYVVNEIGRRMEKKMADVEHCVCCGKVIPEGRQVCVICGYKAEKKMTNHDRIRNMSVDELARFLAEQVMNQEQAHLLEKDTTATHIEFLKNMLFKAYLRYLESEVDTE